MKWGRVTEATRTRPPRQPAPIVEGDEKEREAWRRVGGTPALAAPRDAAYDGMKLNKEEERETERGRGVRACEPRNGWSGQNAWGLFVTRIRPPPEEAMCDGGKNNHWG